VKPRADFLRDNDIDSLRHKCPDNVQTLTGPSGQSLFRGNRKPRELTTRTRDTALAHVSGEMKGLPKPSIPRLFGEISRFGDGIAAIKAEIPASPRLALTPGRLRHFGSS
jgi:hypothetical protein